MSERIGVLLVLLLAACGGDGGPGPGGADAGRGDTGGGLCLEDVECDDGMFCNGAERCTGAGCRPGAAACAGACDETTDTCAPVCKPAMEVCNGGDDDCDEAIDEMLPLSTFYEDADEDMHGAPMMTVEACGPRAGIAATDDDCDDTMASVYPGAMETCNGIDDDCDFVVDDYRGDVCSEGVGACEQTGNIDCTMTCDAVPGSPRDEYRTVPAGNGSFDWDCDGSVEGEYLPIEGARRPDGDYCMLYMDNRDMCVGPMMDGRHVYAPFGSISPACGERIDVITCAWSDLGDGSGICTTTGTCAGCVQGCR